MKNAWKTIRWAMPAVAALGMLLTWNMLRAEDAAPVAPAAGATVSGTVVDADAKPVVGAVVKLVKASDMPQHAKKGEAASQPADGGAKKGKGMANIPSVAETTSDDKGAYTFDKKIADGDYVVIAILKGEGQAHAKVTVANGANPAPVALTLKKGRGGGKNAKPAAN